MRAGQLAGSAAGRKIAALAERLGPETAKRVRRYWELQAWLVVEAEETMMEEAAGDVASSTAARSTPPSPSSPASPSARPQHLSRALTALLPFSRNDYWEVSELRQRIGR